MKKGILGISASALVLQSLSLLVFLVTVLAQRQIKHAMNYPPDIVAEFSIPCVQTVYLLLVTAAGILIRTPVENIRVAGRATQGVIVMRFKEEGDRVISLALADPEEKQPEPEEASL